MKARPIVATSVLLFGPAVLSLVSKPAGLVAAAIAVAVLVYLVLRSEAAGRHEPPRP